MSIAAPASARCTPRDEALESDGPGGAGPADGTRIDVQIAASPAPEAAAVCAWATAALGDDRRCLCVRVVDEAEGGALNARFRARSGATNVLSFATDEADMLGDIAVCAAVVAREARTQGKSLEAHFAHMIVHGVLHLLGMDHDDDVAARRMEARETELLRTLGFQDPYVPT